MLKTNHKDTHYFLINKNFLTFPIQENEIGVPRKRAATLSEGSHIPTGIDDTMLPTVFKWEGGGKNVMISGTFSNWAPLPMVKR